jgi:Tfp pilus assembly protein PilF
MRHAGGRGRPRSAAGGRRLGIGLCLLLGLAGCQTADQDRARLFNEDGIYLYERGNYGPARESFEVALGFQPQDAGLLYNVGQCYDRENNPATAEAFYQRCLAQDANHAPCRHALTLLLYRTGRREEADRRIEDWLAREPKRADAYVEDGWRLRQNGDLQHAQGRLQQALDLERNNVRALTEMALLFEVLELPERAAFLYQQALNQDPRQPAVAERLDLLRFKKVGKPLPD